MVCVREGESGSDRGGSSSFGALVAASTVATLILLNVQQSIQMQLVLYF